MKKFINDPNLVVDEMVEGYVDAHKDKVRALSEARVVVRKDAPVNGKVGIVTGGGSGHKPAFIGYVGKGMVDAVAVGEIFTSPPAIAFYHSFKAADGGKGVACLYGNYAGDVMNVDMAVEMAEDDGITVKQVIANDDVPSAPKGDEDKRRGVAGEILMWKIGSAMAEKRVDHARGLLDEIHMGADRLRMDRGEELSSLQMMALVQSQADAVRALGPNPMKGAKKR